jgi:CheY-like chemotaxis protein
MPDVSGLDVSKEIHMMDPSATVIVYSRMAGGTVEQQAHALGASDVVDKGGSLRPLGQALNQVV